MNNFKRGSHTPWGQAQHVAEIADGIINVSTAGHGGIWLSPERVAAMPEALKTVAYPALPWFEEDCAWCAVFIAFEDDIRAAADPYAFEMINSGAAKETLRNWCPDAHEAHFGVTLNPGESYMKDQRAAKAAKAAA